MSDTSYDAVVIGAGHNGLTAANYLAMGGLSVCVLEKNDVVGGAAISEEFYPGYRNSVASYVVSLLRPEVISDLNLKAYGFETMRLTYSLYLDCEGSYLLLGDDRNENRRQFEKFSARDFEAYETYEALVEEVADLLGDQWLKAPPRLSGGGIGDGLAALSMLLDAGKLKGDKRHRLMQFLIGAPDTIIERWFESDRVKAMMASHIMPANYASLLMPGAGLSMLHHAAGQCDGHKGAWGLVRGGMGTITQAMAASARAKGVRIVTDAEVSKILIEDGRAMGVRPKDGRTFKAKAIAANTEPKRTLLEWAGVEALPVEFAADIRALRQESASLRMNLALKDLPRFAAEPADGISDLHRASITLINSKSHVEAAYFSARAGETADPPIIEAILPSVHDDSLTDAPGTHVMSLLCKYMPYELSGGRDWDTEKPLAVNRILEYLAGIFPNLPEILEGWQCLTPLDIERRFGMPRGDICHGRMELDQMFSLRPHPEAAQYATPIKGLYLCGSGSHPGGGVTGAPGHNGAKRILKDFPRLSRGT